MTARIREFLKNRKDEGPCLVLDIDVVRDNYLAFAKALPDTRIYYAIKANPAAQMTPRELEILRLLGRGDKIVEVADALGISYKTVANTTSLLKQKLGAKNHSDLIRIAVEMGLS